MADVDAPAPETAVVAEPVVPIAPPEPVQPAPPKQPTLPAPTPAAPRPMAALAIGPVGGPIELKASADVLALIKRVNGCKDDTDGISAKKQLVLSFVGSKKVDLLDTMCWLHLHKSVHVSVDGMLRAVLWKKGSVTPNAMKDETSHPALFLATTLAGVDVKEMGTVVTEYFRNNPRTNQIEALRYVNWRGFLQMTVEGLVHDASVVDWKKPLPDGVAAPPRWTKIWSGETPQGSASYVSIRDPKGRKFKLAFLGAIDDNYPNLTTPSTIFLDTWKVPKPATLISADAGSMHPRQFDSENRMAHLPQFHEWVTGVNTGEAAWSDERPPTAVKAVDMLELSRRTVQQWQDPSVLPEQDTDNTEGSVNNLIFEKVKAVFGALLDAATLAGAWVVVDRTGGQGSATAELLIEQALERGAQRPTIIAIDSLERLGTARDGGRNAHSVLKQLNTIFKDSETTTQKVLGIEKEAVLDFGTDLNMFDTAATFASFDDSRLPFDVLAEHKRKGVGTCAPNRKWRYFYVDGLFTSASHYIIKSNDQDEFPIDTVAEGGMCYLYAHGDTRTFYRLRENIQLGRPIVMLHNSGGVVTAFSWLQRVMKFMRPPPEIAQLRAPLKYLIASLSKANWVYDFGAPEVIMMRGLAERAPKLFSQQIVSVDILTNNEEETLEVITGCFASTDSVPELGLGNAEVNVIYNTWNLHLTLCENGKKFNQYSVLAQSFIWVIAVVTTALAIMHISLDGNGVLDRHWTITPRMKLEVKEFTRYAVLILPIITAVITATVSKLLWRDKWSVCFMAASQLTAEIYKFRMKVGPYEPSMLQPKALEGQEQPKQLSPKELATTTRALFVERVQAMYRACVTSLSEGASLKRKTRKVGVAERHDYRTNLENRPTLAQWLKLKVHAEKFFYRTTWSLPVQGFMNWLAGLRPYVQQKTLKEEIRTVIDTLVSDKKIELIGKPLSDGETKLVRQALATKLGLSKKQLEAQQDDVRKIQRLVVVELFKEQEELKKMEKKGGSGSVQKKSEDEEVFYDEKIAMQTQIMQLQGLLGANKLVPVASTIEKKKKKHKGAADHAREVEDDYLVGPLSVESYVIFRVRPIVDSLEQRAIKLAAQLQRCEIATYLINAAGAILAALNWTEWVSLTVALVAVVTGIIEFTQLRNQLVQTNLSLRDLQTLLVRWDSLSVVTRRAPAIKDMFVLATEDALVSIVDAHTTAASTTQTSVSKELAVDEAEEDVAG